MTFSNFQIFLVPSFCLTFRIFFSAYPKHDCLNSLCVWFCIHIGYRGIMNLCMLFLNDSSISLCVWFCIHIGYRCIMIHCELPLNDSSTMLCVWLCIHIGYRGIMIHCELPLNDSSIMLCVWLCIHIGCRGIIILCELSLLHWFILISPVYVSPCICLHVLTLKTQIIRERTNRGKEIFLGSRILFESCALIVHFFQIQTTYKYFNTSLFNLYSVTTFKIDAQRV